MVIAAARDSARQAQMQKRWTHALVGALLDAQREARLHVQAVRDVTDSLSQVRLMGN